MTTKPKPTKRAKAWKPRFAAGWHYAMDADGEWYGYSRKPVALFENCQWGIVWMEEGNVLVETANLTGLPRVPKSQWDKWLFRSNRAGELVRVEVE